jgi:hypothetical protein
LENLKVISALAKAILGGITNARSGKDSESFFVGHRNWNHEYKLSGACLKRRTALIRAVGARILFDFTNPWALPRLQLTACAFGAGACTTALN